jgi:hypothetical protein
MKIEAAFAATPETDKPAESKWHVAGKRDPPPFAH